MTPALVLALNVRDITAFGQPSNRPPRPRRGGATGIVGAMLRSISRELTHAANAADAAPIPRLSNYPY
jgi:hypothetical protein